MSNGMPSDRAFNNQTFFERDIFFNDSNEAKTRILRRGILVYQIQSVTS